MVTIPSGSARKGKVTVAAKKGYKITGLYYCEYGTGKEKKIKNGSTVNVDGNHYLRIEYKNTARNYSYEVYLNGNLL